MLEIGWQNAVFKQVPVFHLKVEPVVAPGDYVRVLPQVYDLKELLEEGGHARFARLLFKRHLVHILFCFSANSSKILIFFN